MKGRCMTQGDFNCTVLGYDNSTFDRWEDNDSAFYYSPILSHKGRDETWRIDRLCDLVKEFKNNHEPTAVTQIIHLHDHEGVLKVVYYSRAAHRRYAQWFDDTWEDGCSYVEHYADGVAEPL